MGYVYYQGADDEGQYALGQTIDWDPIIGMYTDYLRDDKKCGEKHVYDVRNDLTRAARDFEAHGILKPCAVNQHNAKQHLASYRSTGVADITVKHRKVKLCALFSWAWRAELFRVDKLEKLETPQVRDAKRHQPPSLGHIGLIAARIKLDWDPEHAPGSRFKSEEARVFFPTRDLACTLGIADTGARVGEWFGVRIPDVDLVARTIKLHDTKNGDDRLLHMTQRYVDSQLRPWMKLRSGMDVGNDYLWITERGGQIDPSSWGKQFNRYVEHAGIDRRIRRHDLRHLSSSAVDKVSRDASMVIHGHRTDEAHDVYDHPDQAELQRVHDLADPVGTVLQALAAEAAAKAAPPQKQRRVYTKVKVK